MVDFKRLVARAVERVDGWANVLTGVGTVLGGQGRSSYSYQGAERLGEGMLEELYHSDAYAARICEAVPKHALRRGFTVKVGDIATETAVQQAVTRLHVVPRLREAWTWARVFGGGAVLLGCDDGRDPAEPLDTVALRRVLFVTSVTSRELWPETWELDPLNERFGEPVIYRLTRVGGGGGMDTSRVHHSRLVRFEGLPTTRQRRITLKGWGESYLQRAHDLLVEWNGAHTAVNDLVQQSSIGVFKMKDLMSLVASDPDGTLKKRMEAMDLARSVAKSILLDSEGEAYERVEVGALTGLPDLLDRYSLRLAGALEMPVSILLGREPAGLNATGEADTRAWYDSIDAERETTLKPAAERIVKLIMLSQQGPTRAQEPKGWSVEFPPLWQPTESERATLRKTVADTDAVYLQNGVLTPEEVARSRFRPEGWSAETEVDIAARPSPGAPDDDPPPAPSLPAASDAPPAEQEGLAAPARSGMGGAGGPTKPAGLLPIVPANTEGE
jgi:phage-related protein (TIGR01555 family)